MRVKIGNKEYRIKSGVDELSIRDIDIIKNVGIPEYVKKMIDGDADIYADIDNKEWLTITDFMRTAFARINNIPNDIRHRISREDLYAYFMLTCMDELKMVLNIDLRDYIAKPMAYEIVLNGLNSLFLRFPKSKKIGDVEILGCKVKTYQVIQVNDIIKNVIETGNIKLLCSIPVIYQSKKRNDGSLLAVSDSLYGKPMAIIFDYIAFHITLMSALKDANKAVFTATGKKVKSGSQALIFSAVEAGLYNSIEEAENSNVYSFFEALEYLRIKHSAN